MRGNMGLCSAGKKPECSLLWIHQLNFCAGMVLIENNICGEEKKKTITPIQANV